MAETNKFGVPYHAYEILFADGGVSKIVDVGYEDSWGNIQPCIPGDCPDWGDATGIGNDSDGHRKIRCVRDIEDDSIWTGNHAVRTWYETCVACYTDKYAD